MNERYHKGYFLGAVVLTGIVCGFGAILLYLLIDLFSEFFLSGLGGLRFPNAYGEVKIFQFDLDLVTVPYFLIPALGGVLSGMVVYRFAPEAEGHGTDSVIRAFHREHGIIRGRVPVIKALATALTIGSGGSAGREGPVAQIGAGFGSFIAQKLGLSDRERRILVVSGMAGGIGGIFRSPLGGALFGIEVLYRKDAETDGLIYAFITSIISYMVFSLFIFFHHHEFPGSIFRTPEINQINFEEIPFFAITGVVCVAVAHAYVRFFYFVHDIFKDLGMKNWIKPAIGGFVTGMIALAIPQTMGMSYGYVQLAIDGNLGLKIILGLLIAKILATSFTVGSGGSGGVFAPSIVIGSMVGALVGNAINIAIPGAIDVPEIYTIIGMGAFISAVAKTPIASIIMVLEMSGGYELLPAIMTASSISYILSGSTGIYREQMDTRADSPAHRRELIKDILETIRVSDAMTPAENVISVSPSSTAKDVLYLVKTTGHLGFPVIENEKLTGIITLSDINKIPDDEKDEKRIGDIMTRKLIYVSPDESLENALKLLISHDVGRLPVVSDGRLVGIITRSDIMRAHARELAKLEQ